jgi:uncharacterized Tic20 family protein
MNAAPPGAADGRLAVTAQALYLVNLLLLPVVAFAMLWWLLRRRAPTASAFARAHVLQATIASLWGGALLLLALAVFVLCGGPQRIAAWVFALLYLVSVHATLVLLGVVALARAMAGRPFRYPLIGAR